MHKKAGGVLRYNDKYVLVKSRTKDHWVCPKGNVEQGETYEDAVKREACEEAGAVVQVSNICIVVSDVVWYDCEVVELVHDYLERNVRERLIVNIDKIDDVNTSKKTKKVLQMMHDKRQK